MSLMIVQARSGRSLLGGKNRLVLFSPVVRWNIRSSYEPSYLPVVRPLSYHQYQQQQQQQQHDHRKNEQPQQQQQYQYQLTKTTTTTATTTTFYKRQQEHQQQQQRYYYSGTNRKFSRSRLVVHSYNYYYYYHQNNYNNNTIHNNRKNKNYYTKNLFFTTDLQQQQQQQQQNEHERERYVLIQDYYHPENQDIKISVLTLNRPKANAMGSRMISQLQDVLYQLETTIPSPTAIINTTKSETTVKSSSSLSSSSSLTTTNHNNTTIIPRCLIINSFSNKVFSAGADLKERATMTIDEAEEFVTVLRNTFQRVAVLPIPTIAVIEGVAVGGGFELALATDIRIAATTAILGLPETSLGIIPGAGGTQRLSRLIGVGRTKELILTANRIDGTTAHQYGIVQQVVEPGQAYNTAFEMAWKIASNGPIAIRLAKYAIDHSTSTIEDALEIERLSYNPTLRTKDRLEGLQAFHDGRKPNYKGE